MMNRSKKHFFIRDFDAGEYFEFFVVSAITAILAIRLFLRLTGYPQLGGEGLHIAHMLWGGLLMLVAILVMFTLLGKTSMRVAVILGGFGFGTFIDEMGKFVTSDHDYFFKPTFALIYFVFIIIIVLWQAVRQGRDYHEREYLMNAARQVEEMIQQDLDEEEKKQMLYYLSKSDSQSPLVAGLQQAVLSQQLVPVPHPGWWKKMKNGVRHIYRKVAELPIFPTLIMLFFIIQLGLKTVYFFLLIFFPRLNLDRLVGVAPLILPANPDKSTILLAGELFSLFIAAIFVIWGVIRISRSRLEAFSLFEKSILVNIFLTQFFSFYRHQLGALAGLLLNIFILTIIRYMREQEFIISIEKQNISA